MISRGKCILYVLVWVGLSACSNNVKFPSKQTGWVRSAPVESKDLGILIKGVNHAWINQWLSRDPRHGVRNLGAGAGNFYELYGSSLEELKREFGLNSSLTAPKPYSLIFHFADQNSVGGSLGDFSEKANSVVIKENYFLYLDSGASFSLESDQLEANALPRFLHKEILLADQAHSISTGEGVTVAVIDSGVNFSHPDLQGRESLETPGYDFIDGDDDPQDENMHGTAAAGLIAGRYSGIAPEAKVLAIRAFGATGMADAGSVEAALDYAVRAKVNIINASFGYDKRTEEMEQSVRAAEEAEILVVASAGNEGLDTTHFGNFPATFSFSNILSVAALNFDGSLSSYSNYSVANVHIGAPVGTAVKGIYTTAHRPELGNYIQFGGTSAAAPLVAGVAALAESKFQFENAKTLRSKILSAGVEIPALRGKLKYPLRVSALRSVGN